jgi:LuxR family maltose regulon positive regulatory protein
LQRRLQEIDPSRIIDLHLKASRWYEQEGQISKAIHHAVCAGNDRRAAQLVEASAEHTLMSSQVATLDGWLAGLPESTFQTHPSLYAYHAWTLILMGRPLSEAEQRLEKALQADQSQTTQGFVNSFKAIIAIYQGDRAAGAELAQQALTQLPENNLFLRSLLAGTLGLSFLWAGKLNAARQVLEEGLRVSQRAGNLMNAVLALSHLGEIALYEARFHEAFSIFERAEAMAVDRQQKPLPIAGVPMISKASTLYEWNQLRAAEAASIQGIELVKEWGEAGAINGYLILSRICNAQGDELAAQAAIQDAYSIAARFDAMQLDDISVALSQAKLWTVQGNYNAVERWVSQRGLDRQLRQLGEPGLLKNTRLETSPSSSYISNTCSPAACCSKRSSSSYRHG